MALVDEIERAQSMIHGAVDQLHFLYGERGYLDRLTKAALAGGYVTAETIEAMQMEKDVALLRKTATEIEGLRAKLIANQPTKELT